MKIGLIARCETSRGLAIQTRNFYDHMPVDKTLLVRRQAHALDCDEAPWWYPDATHITYDHYQHTLDERQCMEWLDGLDVVFTVETTYDWRFSDWARKAGVKTVIQGNPEFYRHDQDDGFYRAHPDAWWWPTTWRMDRLPPGKHMPVPMPDRPWTARVDRDVRLLHVVGKRAFEDRNGTDIVINALRSITEPCDFTLSGFGWETPRVELPTGCPVRLTQEEAGVADHWSMYDDQSLLVLPRRYAGLCLPALEAAACGVAVLMPSIAPNDELAQLFIGHSREHSIKLACGVIQAADVDFRQLGERLSDYVRDPDQVWDAQLQAYNGVPRWSGWQSVYLEELENVCQR